MEKKFYFDVVSLSSLKEINAKMQAENRARWNLRN